MRRSRFGERIRRDVQRAGTSRPPAGPENQRPAARHDVGKTVKRDEPETKSAGRQVK
jgi:hypothetical protein